MTFQEYLDGKPFSKLDSGSYYAEYGHIFYESYDIFWRSVRNLIKSGHILTLDDDLWVYAPQDKRDDPVNTTGPSLLDVFDTHLRIFIQRYPKI